MNLFLDTPGLTTEMVEEKTQRYLGHSQLQGPTT